MNDYRSALEACPTPLMLVSQDGGIVHSNQRFDALFGYEDGELQGQSVELLIPQELRDKHRDLSQAYLEIPTTRGMGTGRDLIGVCKDGTIIPIEIGLEPIKSEGAMFVMVSVLDIRERKAGENKIRRALDAASSAMVMIDENGEIQLVNEQTKRMFGYSAQELIGQSIEILVPERARRKHAVYRVSYQSTRDRRAMGAGRDLFGLRKDGTEFPVEIGLTPIDDGEDRLIMATVIDTTARKQNEENIRRKNEELERLNRELLEFAYSASHDLKAPLSSVIGLLDLISSDMATGDQEEAMVNLERAQELTRHLAGRVETMLVLAKTDSVEVGWHDLVISDAVAEVWQVLQAGGKSAIDFRTDFNHAEPVRTVPARFHIVLENLLSNAIKYRDQDKPESWVAVETWDRDGVFHLTVRDNGIGIPTKFHGRIFQLFKQVAETSNPGSGLGLALVQKNMQRLGGDIMVASTDDGSAFTIALPRENTLTEVAEPEKLREVEP